MRGLDRPPGPRRSLRLATLLCLVLLSASSAAEVGVRRRMPGRVERAPREEAVVGGLRFEGNRVLSGADLKSVIFTRGPTWRTWRPPPLFSESALIGDLERIESLYEQRGYYEASASYSLRWNHAGNTVAITITIDEGSGIETAEMEITLLGAEDLGDDERDALLEELALGEGEPFSPVRYGRAKEQILDRLANVGHPAATIRGGAEVDLETHTATLRWEVDAGPLVHFGEVEVTGLYLVRERTVRRELRLSPGDRYDRRKLARTRVALQRLGLFSWVGISAEPAKGQSPDPPWPVRIRLSERSPYTADAGIGYSSDESFRASAGLQNRNFFGDARKLRLRGVYSGILSKAELEVTQPYLFGTRIAVIGKIAYRHENEPAFTADRLLPSVGISRGFSQYWRARATYEFSFNNVTRTSEDVNVELDEPLGRLDIATLELGLRRQTLDDLLDPSRGTWLDLAIAPSIAELGSGFDYITYLAEARGFWSWGPVVFAGRVRIGAIQPLRDTTADTVPVVSRFYSGGSNSFRGFAYHEMPPVDSVDANVGGTSLLESSAEIRFPILGKLRGVLFVDAGLLDREPFRYPLDELFWAAGPGLRYDTLVGPLRLDFGALLNPPDADTGRFQWFISVGHSF